MDTPIQDSLSPETTLPATTPKRDELPNPLKSLLPRQRRFLKEFLKTQDRTSAWMKVYRCKARESALVASNRFLHQHPDVVDWLYQLSGLGDDDFARVIREGMGANKSLFYQRRHYIEPDHYARFKAVELGLKVRGKDAPQNKGNQMNIQIINDSTHGVFKIIENVENE